MKKVELLAPAGDLTRLKIAILYGADAVFVGGKQFSLRAKANNFSLDDLKEAVIFANKHHARVHATVNIVPEEEDFEGLDEYLLALSEIGVHAIIVSSMYVILRAKKLGCKFEIHVSTQQSIANYEAINFFKQAKADRVVLARELNIKQIENIKRMSPLPIEVFIHGGMCSSFSGRCSLSNVMVNRDANKGGCAHSCRWIYNLYNNDKLISDDKFIMASCDLMSIDYITKLLDIGVDSFKIEGRMKSIHYIASIVSTYRRLIDEYYNKKEISRRRINYYKKEISKAENRVTYTGFLNPHLKNQAILTNTGDENPTQTFIAIVLKKLKDGYLLVEQRNNFKLGDKIECLSSSGQTIKSKIYDIKDEQDNHIDVARHPQQIVKIKINKVLEPNSLIRKMI